jgi:hypothetical protein
MIERKQDKRMGGGDKKRAVLRNLMENKLKYE